MHAAGEEFVLLQSDSQSDRPRSAGQQATRTTTLEVQRPRGERGHGASATPTSDALDFQVDKVTSITFEPFTFVRMRKPHAVWRYAYVTSPTQVSWDASELLEVLWATDQQFGGLPIDEHGSPRIDDRTAIYFGEDNSPTELQVVDPLQRPFQSAAAHNEGRARGHSKTVDSADVRRVTFLGMSFIFLEERS